MTQKIIEYCLSCNQKTDHKEVKGLESNDNGVIQKYYKCEKCNMSYVWTYLIKALNYCPKCVDFTIQIVGIRWRVEWTNFKFTCKCGHIERNKELHPLQSVEEIIMEALMEKSE